MRNIKILGIGCPRCDQLAAAAKQAADQLGFEYELDKIKDISEFPSLWSDADAGSGGGRQARRSGQGADGG